MDSERDRALSVLVPVYNVEGYLRQCLDSLAAQPLAAGEAEFICLDDGSTDSSPAILDEYAASDARFVVVHKRNSGYGATMNEGLRRARGRYVGILESDDWIEPGGFARLLDFADACGRPDIVKANYIRVDEEGERVRRTLPADLCGRRLELADEDIAKPFLGAATIWAAIYRREFLVSCGIGFLETPGAAYQDTGFVNKSWIAADTAAFCDDAFVHYRAFRAGSSSASSDKAFRVCDELASIDAFARSMPERYERFAGLLAARRFLTYEWNLGRIGRGDERAFIERAAGEFRALDAEGAWSLGLLVPKKRKKLKRWMGDPHGFFCARRARDAESRGRKIEAAFWRLRARASRELND